MAHTNGMPEYVRAWYCLYSSPKNECSVASSYAMRTEKNFHVTIAYTTAQSGLPSKICDPIAQ